MIFHHIRWSRRAFWPDGLRFRSFFTNRTIDKPCLTKSAASNTSAKNLANSSVVHNINKRHNKPVRIINLVKITDNTFFTRFGAVALFSIFLTVPWRYNLHHTVTVHIRPVFWPLHIKIHIYPSPFPCVFQKGQ